MQSNSNFIGFADYQSFMAQEWIDVFVERMLDTFADMDFRTLQPFVNLELESLYAGLYLENLSKAIENPSTLENLAQARGKVSAGTLSDQMLFTAINLKMAGWPREKRLQVLQFFHDALKKLHAGGVFVSNGQNCVLTQSEAESALDKLELQEGSPAAARELGKLYTAMYHLSNGLYSDMYMGICIQNYGAYDVSAQFGKGCELVIKNAFHLKPVDVWEECANFPAGEVKIYCIYRNAGFHTDLFSCHSQYRGDPINGLVKWVAEVDGKQVGMEEIEKLISFYSRASTEYWRKITSLPFEELKRKGLMIRQFAVKPFFDAAGMDWKPTDEMFQAIKGKPFRLPPALAVPTSDREHWRKIVDPRIDFELG